MTMEDDNDASSVESFALHVVLFPILDELEKIDLSAAQTLRAAFEKAEKQNPGISQDIISGVLEARSAGVSLNTECLLKLAALDSEEYMLRRKEDVFEKLNEQAKELKKILARLPDEIGDRPKFLQTIKDIASGIKDLLEALNRLIKKHGAGRLRDRKSVLDAHKKEFINSSKNFSDTLKVYFRDGHITNVYKSANKLVNDTNTILKMLKSVGN
ncbi:programmed cell death protein 10-A-like [Patiria miniata]|uniref:Programmed cell death protein 10 dimerisation domain-containing protein n=1 Tax=Patiria miniata TaxID=46514 RepID=A0A913ZGQ0_PATMI|nr:programmed cell death protein 10-A-like [Patiria miniata]